MTNKRERKGEFEMAKTSKTDNIITTEYFEACVQNIESSLKRLAEQNESRDKMISDLLKDGPVQVISDEDARKLISDTITSSLIGKTVKAEVKPITVTAELPYGTESALRSVVSSASQLSSAAESITRAEERRRQWWQRVRNHKDALLFGPLVLLVIAMLAGFIYWRTSDEFISRSAYETAVTLQMENPGKVYHDVRQGLADPSIREKTKGRVRDLKRLLKDAQEGK